MSTHFDAPRAVADRATSSGFESNVWSHAVNQGQLEGPSSNLAHSDNSANLIEQNILPATRLSDVGNNHQEPSEKPPGITLADNDEKPNELHIPIGEGGQPFWNSGAMHFKDGDGSTGYILVTPEGVRITMYPPDPES